METLDFHKTKPGVVDVDFKAWDIQLHGMHNIQVPVIIDPGGNIALSGEESARPAPYGSPRSQAGHSGEDALQNPSHGISLSSPGPFIADQKFSFICWPGGGRPKYDWPIHSKRHWSLYGQGLW